MIKIIILVFLVVSCAYSPKKISYTPYKFSKLNNWENDDHASAISAFIKSCDRFVPYYQDKNVSNHPKITKTADWEKLCLLAKSSAPGNAREFFEDNFKPYLVMANKSSEGLFTGYHEPYLRASRTKSEIYKYPIYKSPNNLDDIKHLLDRKTINEGKLDGMNLELFYTDSDIDLFFTHIQGSAKLLFDDGSTIRIGYKAQNGHKYYPIGKYLIDELQIDKELITADYIKTLLSFHKNAKLIMELNPSYIFFDIKDDIYGAFGASLTAERSLAIDKSFIPYGIPLRLETSYPKIDDELPALFNKLMIAQDTGGAIKGAIRGDVFFGSDDKAARFASNMKQKGRYFILLPK